MNTEMESAGVIAREVMLLLRRAESARKQAETLDRSAYLLLEELEARGPLGIAALADTFQVDVSTASRQTAALESKGLVERLPDPLDGRACLLRITPRGQARFQTTRAARQAMYADLLKEWPEEDRRRFGAYLARLNRDIRERHRIRTPVQVDGDGGRMPRARTGWRREASRNSSTTADTLLDDIRSHTGGI